MPYECYFRQRYSKYSVKYLCIPVLQGFHKLLCTNVFFPIVKLLSLAIQMRLKITFSYFFLICQAVFSCVLCVAFCSEVLGMSRPEGLCADVGTGCIKL